MKDSNLPPDNRRDNQKHEINLKVWIETGRNFFDEKESDIYANSLRGNIDVESIKYSKHSGKLCLVAIILMGVYIFLFYPLMPAWIHAPIILIFSFTILTLLAVMWKMWWFVGFVVSLIKSVGGILPRKSNKDVNTDES